VKGSGQEWVAFAHRFLRDSRLMVVMTNAFDCFFVANKDSSGLVRCSHNPISSSVAYLYVEASNIGIDQLAGRG
jgi:hypothetical protein